MPTEETIRTKAATKLTKINSDSSKAGTFDAKPKLRRAGSLDSTDIFVFLIPCLRFVEFHVVGLLSGSDLLLFVAFIFLVFRGGIRITTPTGKTLIALCSLWLVSQCITDIVRHTAFADYARGWSNIGLTLVNFAVLYTLLYGRPRRLLLYAWGLVVGSALTFLISPDELMAADPWKFGISYPATLAILLLASKKNCRGHWPITLSVMLGLINIFMGTRNQGGACLAVALYLLVTRYMRRRSKDSSKLKAATLMAIAASIILGAVGILWAYQYAASAGILGEDAKTKYEGQSSGKYGILLGGRTEMLGSIPAIYDSPILGHGSWAKDPTYLIEERQALAALGYSNAEEVSVDELEEGLIPAHSYIFGAWVDAGIAGAVFWVWVFFLTARSLMRVYPATVVFLPLASFFAFSLLWDLLYSPYGAQMRIVSPYYVVVLMTCLGMVFQKTVPVAVGVPKQRIAATSTS